MLRALWMSPVVLCLLCATGFAAEYAVGDTVHIRWAATNYAAKVVSVEKSGWIKVKFPQNGKETTVVLPPDKVFAGNKDLLKSQDNKQQKQIELLRTNSDGKNASSTETRPWHGPGRAGNKYGPVLFSGRVKAYRTASPFILFETKDRKEVLLKIEEICNADRKIVFDLARRQKKK